jgi:hypothetical protein
MFPLDRIVVNAAIPDHAEKQRDPEDHGSCYSTTFSAGAFLSRGFLFITR